MRKTNLCLQGLRQLRRLFEEGKSLELHFPAEDLDFRYLEGALVPDSDGAPEPHSAEEFEVSAKVCIKWASPVRPDEHIAWRVKISPATNRALMDARAPEYCLVRCEYFRASSLIKHCSKREYYFFLSD
ncbi:hypothetical protein DKX38_015300 [Salix brachista]|uniref:Uncharacterized protein n=1 Tax=Salix brachista TaxID=2182728 RepID=A0A5N5L4T8_9ROSI|nr:hypothetical protein DKX38_015300 [Salix brachista]